MKKTIIRKNGLLAYILSIVSSVVIVFDFKVVFSISVSLGILFFLGAIVLLICQVIALSQKIEISNDNIRIQYAPFIYKEEITYCEYMCNVALTNGIYTDSILLVYKCFFINVRAIFTPEFKQLIRYISNHNINVITKKKSGWENALSKAFDDSYEGNFTKKIDNLGGGSSAFKTIFLSITRNTFSLWIIISLCGAVIPAIPLGYGIGIMISLQIIYWGLVVIASLLFLINRKLKNND